MNLEQTFQTLREGYVPQDGDHADAIPFYRDFHAVRGIIGSDLFDRLNHAIHGAFRYAYPEHTWGGIYRGVLAYFDSMALPKKPEYVFYYGSMPSWNIEDRARDIFKSQFREAFPGKKLNSKFAHDKWAEVKDRAIEMSKVEFDAEVAAHNKQESDADKTNESNYNSWIEKVHDIARLEEEFRKFE
jgi:hypothetical protein